MQKKTSIFFFSFGCPNLRGGGWGSTWLGQKTKFFDRFNLKASLTTLHKFMKQGIEKYLTWHRSYTFWLIRDDSTFTDRCPSHLWMYLYHDEAAVGLPGTKIMSFAFGGWCFLTHYRDDLLILSRKCYTYMVENVTLQRKCQKCSIIPQIIENAINSKKYVTFAEHHTVSLRRVIFPND